MEVEIMGRKFEVAPEPADFWGWVKEGRYDAEWRMMLAFLRPEHTFLDLGAWIGSHSLLASTVCHSALAIEPDPVAFKILSTNIKGTKISALRGAVSDKFGELILGSGRLGHSTTRLNPNAGGGIGAWEPGQTFETMCTILSDYVKLVDHPLFIKMDIEGSEEQVLSDLSFFEEHRPTLMLETHPWWWKDPDFWNRLVQLGRIYKRVLNRHLLDVDILKEHPKEIIFTNRD